MKKALHFFICVFFLIMFAQAFYDLSSNTYSPTVRAGNAHPVKMKLVRVRGEIGR